MLHLRIFLPRDRRQPGVLALLRDDAPVLPPMPCLGMAHPDLAAREDDPLRFAGPTPTGAYLPAKVVRFWRRDETYGAGFIALDGASGQALQARAKHCRSLRIHGGGGDRLVPYNGGVVVMDCDWDALDRAIGGEIVEIDIDEIATVDPPPMDPFARDAAGCPLNVRGWPNLAPMREGDPDDC